MARKKHHCALALTEWLSVCESAMVPFIPAETVAVANVADDPRFFDIMMRDWPYSKLPILRRPWVQAEIYNRYPVEYRVFVRDSVIAGISSYYPQRPLLKEHGERDIPIVTAYAEALIKECPRWHWPVRHGLDPNRKHFTADFMRTKDGELLFLEGGPPYTPRWGAHPCCFEGQDIAGVALSRKG